MTNDKIQTKTRQSPVRPRLASQVHNNQNLTDEEAEWYLESIPAHRQPLFEKIPPREDSLLIDNNGCKTQIRSIEKQLSKPKRSV